jgi:anthranilate phosphoribosyltransferase
LLLGVRRALVVHGSDGLDEITLAGSTAVIETADGRLRRFEWQPSDFGLEYAGCDTMLVSGPEESAEVISEILSGRRGSPRDIVVANAAAALWMVGRASSPQKCAELAADAIDSGAARDLLARLIEKTNR